MNQAPEPVCHDPKLLIEKSQYVPEEKVTELHIHTHTHTQEKKVLPHGERHCYKISFKTFLRDFSICLRDELFDISVSWGGGRAGR